MKVASSSTVMDYGSAFDYRSVYSYGRNIYTDNDPYGSEKITAPKSNSRESFQLGSLLSMLATFICYTLVVVTFPVCFFLYLKRVKPFEKAVVFRLGKVRAAEGPGMVLILPFVDRCTIVNLQETDIEVHLQQFLSCDNAVVQCGARIRFRISNPVLYSTSYYDPNHGGLRSLVKSVLLKNGVKHRQKDFEPGSSGIESLSEAISSELNGLVNMWGIDIVTTFMLDVAVLKVAEQQNPVEPVLKSLLGQVGNFPPVSKDTSNALISNLIKLHGGAGPSTACTSATSGKIRSHIDELLSNAANIEKLQLGGVGGILRIDISSPNGTIETVFVDLRGKTLPMAEEYNVQLKCSEETALGLLSKTLSPTTAILTNQIQASGDVDLLKKFMEFL